MFKHGFIKLFLFLGAISLLMALTGFSSKQLVVLTLLNQGVLGKNGKGDDEDYFVEVEAEIKGSSQIELYENALRALKESRMPIGINGETAFNREFKINHVTKSINTVIVDFSSRNLTGNKREESLLIGQIVKTLTRSFDEVEAVAFTVDGEAAETLMGHVDITESFTEAPMLEI